MTDKTLMRPMTITLELSEPEPGVYVARAVSDDGDHTLAESTESLYEAACDTLATVAPSIDPMAGS